MPGLIAGQPAVAGWSEFGFGQLPVDGRVILPVMGVQRRLGAVEPPTTSGHPITGADQMELGPVTLREQCARATTEQPQGQNGHIKNDLES